MLRKTLQLTALAVLLISLAPVLRADAPKAGDKDLEGEWELVAAVKKGKDLPMPPAKLGKQVMIFKGDSLTVKLGDRVLETDMFTADPAKTPKAVDSTPQDGDEKGKTKLCIYEVKDDVLRLCVADEGQDRPMEFSAKPDEGRTLITLKRVKK
jgi:uncharacterized protein (TIGR03067 family)